MKDNYAKTLKQLIAIHKTATILHGVMEERGVSFKEKYECFDTPITDIEPPDNSLYVPCLAPHCCKDNSIKWYSLYLAPLLYDYNFKDISIYVGF